jgi:hypothetical protein
MPAQQPTNRQIAEFLDTIADHLAAKDENPFRVGSYRKAAVSVRGSRIPLAKRAREKGPGGLRGVAGIGEKLAGLIDEYVKDGKSELLETLRKEVRREELEKVRAAKHEAGPSAPLLPVGQILAIDMEYRDKAKAGTLKKIAPRLLNPEKKAWLPIFVAERHGWKFTTMFSNTSTAHKLGKTNDWVVVYYEKGKGENQCTVVTEQRGELKGKRVIRGRESECKKHYGLA